MWEKVAYWIDWFCNKPLPVVGVSCFIVCIFAWKIFKGTSFGKKKYNQMKLKVEAFELVCKNTMEESKKRTEEIKKEADAKVKAIETYYETKLAQKQAKEDKIEALVCAIGDNIHNEKISALISEYRATANATQTIMTDKIEEVKSSYEERIRALEEKIYGEINKAEELSSSKEE